MKTNNEWLVADFETKTEKFFIENGYTEIWLYAVSNPQGEITSWGKTLPEFFNYCSTLHNTTIYFHNLKFDGMFIIDYLINNKYEYKDRVYARDSKCYNTLISEDGAFYQITVHFGNKHTVKFQDSLKLLPFKVEKIAKDFNLPIRKLNIDYDDYTIDDDRLQYVFNDVAIVALALQEIKENGMLEMTTASCAYHNYIDSCQFHRSLFPVLDKEFLIEWRNAYRGGRSQVNPIFQGVTIANVKRFDINSMYPYIMHDLELPYGMPIKITKRGRYNFELYKIEVKFKLKEGHLPTLLKKNVIFGNQSYYTEHDGMEYIWISNIDYELLERHYNISYVRFVEMYGFRTSNYMFKKYIDKWYEVKCNSKGAKKTVAKLMLNSLYGKFGSNCVGKSKIPQLDEYGIVHFVKSEEQEMRKYYLPVAIAITSYAHKLIDDAICETGYDNFVYCDTDSVHTIGDLPQHMIDQTLLGKFKLEAIELKSKYVRQKTYVYCELENDDLVYNIVCAGMTEECKNNAIEKYGDDIFKVFKEGFTIDGLKLLPKTVKGGVVLCKTTFQIKGSI